jgi:exopolysaccharide biosynthesis protein
VQFVDEAIDVGFGHNEARVRLPIVLLCGLIGIAGPADRTVSPPGLRSEYASPLPSDGEAGRLADLAFLGAPERVADGVDLFRVDGAVDLSPPGQPRTPGRLDIEPLPRSVRLLRLDPRRVRLASALATGEVPARATVLDIARRTRALAAVNAGFFSPTGDPNGLLKIDGRLLSDTGRARGAVALTGRDRVEGLFDQVSARVRLRVRTGGRWQTVPVDGVDTARGTGRLVLYSPASGASTGTAGGLEWTLRPGSAGPGGGPTVFRVSAASTAGDGAIPPDGYVLSHGGVEAPAALAGLVRSPSVQVRESLVVHSGHRVRDWMRAATIVGGAGLLVRGGRPLTDWAIEQLSQGFETTPHPRTVIARDRVGLWWLITIDGRQPGRAVGMSFTEMQALLARLDVTDALNLDGGGSTTMVVGDAVLNRPSDPTGPRPVSDAVIVIARAPPRR